MERHGIGGQPDGSAKDFLRIRPLSLAGQGFAQTLPGANGPKVDSQRAPEHVLGLREPPDRQERPAGFDPKVGIPGSQRRGRDEVAGRTHLVAPRPVHRHDQTPQSQVLGSEFDRPLVELQRVRAPPGPGRRVSAEPEEPRRGVRTLCRFGLDPLRHGHEQGFHQLGLLKREQRLGPFQPGKHRARVQPHDALEHRRSQMLVPAAPGFERDVEQGLARDFRGLGVLRAGRLYLGPKRVAEENDGENRPGAAHEPKIGPGPGWANRGDAPSPPASCAVMNPTRRLWLVALAGIACATCSEELAPPEPDRETIGVERFRGVLSDMVVARIEIMPDTAAYERRLAEILRQHDVSPDELRGFVEVHGQNDDLVSGVYAQVAARLDSLYPAGRATAGIDSLVGTLGAGDTVTPAP